MSIFGFIVLRHVNNIITGNAWKMCYESIRYFHSEVPIVIIDDFSDYSYIDVKYEQKLYNTTIIKSEFKGRGELLPYIYYLKFNFFDTAIIIHDSIILNSSFTNYVYDVNYYRMLWHFDHRYDDVEIELNALKQLKNSEKLIDFYNKKNDWVICFGAMSIIKYQYLKYIDDLFDISRLIDVIKCRKDRQGFERIIAVILQFQYQEQKTCFGNIGDFCPWGINMDDYIYLKYIDKDSFIHKLPVHKIWFGR